MCKAKDLSLEGRISLIKAVISCLPVYFLSILICPMSVANRIEKLECDFLWQSGEEVKKFYLVDWDSVWKPKLEGGLDFMHIRHMNQALLGKWLWRMGIESGGLWRSIILAKYGNIRNGWGLNLNAARGSAL